MAGDELGKVAPVRADVGERARGAAELVVDAPVRVVRAEQPVLEVGAVQQVQRAGPAAADALARLADGRVVAVDERDAGVKARARRERPTRRLAPSRSGASGFSQITCLPASSAASASGRWRWFGVQTWTTSTSGSRTISSAESKARSAPRLLRRRGGRLGRRGGDPRELDAGQPERSCVNPADEPGARDRGLERHRARDAKRNFVHCQAKVASMSR